MSRQYTHVQAVEKEMPEMKAAGKINRKIVEQFMNEKAAAHFLCKASSATSLPSMFFVHSNYTGGSTLLTWACVKDQSLF